MPMTKVVHFPTPVPEKFGPQRVGKREELPGRKPGQLNLFNAPGGKVVSLHKLSPFEEALMLDDRGENNQAKQLYLKAIETGESIADAYCNLGILEWQDNHHTKAIDSFTKCLALEPRHHEAQYNLANLYAELGNFPLAKAHYEIAIQIEPEFPNSHFNLALTLAMSKQYREAIAHLETYRTLVSADEHPQTDSLIRMLQNTLS